LRITSKSISVYKQKAISEYARKVGSGESIDLYTKNRNFYGHNINKNLLKSHNLRLKKIQNYEKYCGITGTSEYLNSYLFHDKNLYKLDKYNRVHLNYNYPPLPPIGRSEYVDKFVDVSNVASQNFAFNEIINPKLSVESATHPRPLAKPNHLGAARSETYDSHQWPKLEDRTQFDWMKSRYQ
jgi:hypothetical protein